MEAYSTGTPGGSEPGDLEFHHRMGLEMSGSTILRVLLIIDIVSMAALAAFYLRQRRLSWLEYCEWGLLAVMVPLLGPFLVIINHPGEWRDASSRELRVPKVVQGRIFAILGPRRPPRVLRKY